ncbi:hypothetical protein BCR34DRAFT_557861 [Clohesyomyces aquaticus]|uniref:Uncharacterized protein n=1 Tax=Clohesyomyces aquaticus TaxID=1231657 RepID=A0A1Y2A085_9PLEO|nr:hypothetical protein BCR34DRAFT_557861 [Clohesyomyces aquaticus]
MVFFTRMRARNYCRAHGMFSPATGIQISKLNTHSITSAALSALVLSMINRCPSTRMSSHVSIIFCQCALLNTRSEAASTRVRNIVIIFAVVTQFDRRDYTADCHAARWRPSYGVAYVIFGVGGIIESSRTSTALGGPWSAAGAHVWPHPSIQSVEHRYIVAAGWPGSCLTLGRGQWHDDVVGRE